MSAPDPTDAEREAPFADVPEGIDIARYFWHEIVLADQREVPYRRGQYHGCDGISLWREGGDYCYLWVEATVDHDIWMGYLLEVRTGIGGRETRDHLYLAAGGGDLFEVEWRNQPIGFNAPLDDHIDHHRAAMRWFVERDVGTIEEQNGGDQGIIDRAAKSDATPDASSVDTDTGHPRSPSCSERSCGQAPPPADTGAVGDVEALARVVTAQMKDNRWRDLTPLAIARAVLASDWLHDLLDVARREGGVEALREAADAYERMYQQPGSATGADWLRRRAAHYGGVR